MGKTISQRFGRSGNGGAFAGIFGIVSVTFTDNPPFETNGQTLFARVVIRKDDSEKDNERYLPAGQAEHWVISEDGRELTPADEKASLFGAFIDLHNSLVELGVEEVEYEDGEAINFDYLIGARAQLSEVKDEQATARMVKKVKATPRKYSKFNAEGQRQGKDGKYYDLRKWVATELLSTGEDYSDEREIAVLGAKEETSSDDETPATPAKGKTTKPAAKQTAAAKSTSAAKGGVVNKKAAKEAAETQLSEQSKTLGIGAFRSSKKAKLRKSELNLAFTRHAANVQNREQLRDAFWNQFPTLVEQEVFHQESGKDGYITLGS